jgi:hypothetical protein
METKSNNPSEITSQISEGQEENSQALPIEEINKAKATSEMHFDGNSTFYSLNEHEFKTIKRGSDNLWKELTIAAVALFLPLLLNTIATGNSIQWTNSSWNLFFNGIFTITTLILAICFGIAWYNSKKETEEIIKRIESKPKFKL